MVNCETRAISGAKKITFLFFLIVSSINLKYISVLPEPVIPYNKDVLALTFFISSYTFLCSSDKLFSLFSSLSIL